jgi:hypothetical protein
MSVTNTESLLRIMSVQRAMQMEGTTRPAPAVREATKELVDKLAGLDSTEAINVVVIAEEPLHSQYLRVKIGELLAEIRIPSK